MGAIGGERGEGEWVYTAGTIAETAVRRGEERAASEREWSQFLLAAAKLQRQRERARECENERRVARGVAVDSRSAPVALSTFSLRTCPERAEAR
jgi:hypothetical protein